ncbi:MAG: delta-60 repeat domain-containing protein [Lysobacterales bacterium]
MPCFPIILATALALALLQAATPATAQTLPGPVPNLMPEVQQSGQWYPGTVSAMLRQRDGKILVGGSFMRVEGGVPRANLLRLNADGTLDEDFAPQIGGSGGTVGVYALAVWRDRIYVGGLLTNVNGANGNSIVRLHMDGTPDTTWVSPFSSTTYNQIWAIAVTPAGVFVGGDIQDHDAWGLARLSLEDGQFDPSWVAQTQASPTANPTAGNRGAVHALAVTGGDLLVGGGFRQIAGVERAGAARLSQSAPATVGAFDGNLNSDAVVYSLELDGDRVYLGGSIHLDNIYYLARFDAGSGVLDSAWRPAIGSYAYSLHLDVDMLYVGGSFTNAVPGGARLLRIPVTGDGTIDTGWNPNASNTVYAIADNGYGLLVAGGSFVTMSGEARNGLAGFGVPENDIIFIDGFDGE